MKKNIYLLIISIITIFCAVIGVCAHNYSGNGWGIFKKELQQKNEVLQEFDVIEIDSEIMSVTLTSGDEYRIDCEYNKDSEPEFEVKNGTLQLSQKQNRLWNNWNRTCTVVVTIPENKNLQDMNIKSDVGNIAIENITSENLTFRGDVGNLEVTKSGFEMVNVKSNIGNVEFDNTQFTQMVVKNDIGNVEVNSSVSLADYSMKLDADLGEVEVYGKEEGHEYEYSASSDKTLEISAEIGDIEVED